MRYPDLRLTDMILPDSLRVRLQRVLGEQRQQAGLREHGLVPRRKLLLIGPPGSGKTMTASALAGELHLPLFTIVLDGLITKFMGETAAKLRLVFDAMQATRGVYFFDEFDAIGARRGEPTRRSSTGRSSGSRSIPRRRNVPPPDVPMFLPRQPSKHATADPRQALSPSSISVKADVESEAGCRVTSQSIHRCPDVL